MGAMRVLHGGTESTDHATVGARVVSVGAETAGVVAELRVKDHDVVEKGAVLLRLDAAALDAKLTRARAELASAQAMLAHAERNAGFVDHQVDTTTAVARGDESAAVARERSLDAETTRAQAAVDAAASALANARQELDRVRTLHAQQALSDAHLQEAEARWKQADAEERRARALVVAAEAERLAAQGSRVAASGKVKLSASGAERGIADADVALARARVDEARAGVELAGLEVARATVVAPMRGTVERHRVEAGSYVTAGSELLVLVAADDVWIDAEFKEGQLDRLVPGARADVEVDAFSGHPLAGHVESIGGATTGRTALLQTSGNGLARVSQRVPVRIALDEKPTSALVAGLNASVSVKVPRR